MQRTPSLFQPVEHTMWTWNRTSGICVYIYAVRLQFSIRLIPHQTDKNYSYTKIKHKQFQTAGRDNVAWWCVIIMHVDLEYKSSHSRIPSVQAVIGHAFFLYSRNHVAMYIGYSTNRCLIIVQFGEVRSNIVRKSVCIGFSSVSIVYLATLCYHITNGKWTKHW